MNDKKVVLVTGVSKYWGAQVATRLLDRSDSPIEDANQQLDRFHVIGIDGEPPKTEINGLDFIQTDVRNPLLLDLLRTENIDTVCHLVFDERSRPSEASFDLNVMGTMKLLGACAEAGVRKVVLRSSTAVYGAKPSNPAFLTEKHPLQGDKRQGAIGNLVEIEAFCNGFRRQVPDMLLTILRFSSIIGPDVDTRFTRYLKQPIVPTLLGFNPLMQVIHESDVVAAIINAIVNDKPGVFNVAAEGTPPLAKLLALAGRSSVPVLHLCAYWSKPLLHGYWPVEVDYLRYPWVADLTRMRDEMGFIPQYTAVEALREFASQQRLGKYKPDEPVSAKDEELLRDIMERRRRMKEQQVTQAVD
jgi:UDP-glucose 4-epimerase